MKADVELIQPGLYGNLEAEVRQTLGLRADSSKPLVARYVAQQLVERDIVPAFVECITRHLKSRLDELQHSIA